MSTSRFLTLFVHLQGHFVFDPDLPGTGELVRTCISAGEMSVQFPPLLLGSASYNVVYDSIITTAVVYLALITALNWPLKYFFKC